MRAGGIDLFDFPNADNKKCITIAELDVMFLDALDALKYIISKNVSDMSCKCNYDMEDDFWEDLTLKILADKLNISTHFLDKILNGDYRIVLPKE